MYRLRPGVSKSYDFETTDRLYYHRFQDILEKFGLLVYDNYFGSTYDYHTIRFCCDLKTRVLVEYIFRRSIGLKRLYLLDLDCYQNRAKRYKEENYAIF